MYYFGKYSVSIITTMGSSLFFPSTEYVCYIYYGSFGNMNNRIHEASGFSSEANALIWAKQEIEKHRAAMKELKNVTGC